MDDKVWPFDVLSTLAHEWDAPVFCQHFVVLRDAGFALHAAQSEAA